jgi:S1-C subfamily serine protease
VPRTRVLRCFFCSAVVLLASAICLLSAIPASASEIDACKYLVVTDFTADPFGIAKELREQARNRGFIVISSPSEAESSERFTVCVLGGSWTRTGSAGSVAVKVKDTLDGDLLAEAAASGTAWWSVNHTVRVAVKKIYDQLGYTGYSNTVFNSRLRRLYPMRPTLTVTEKQITSAMPSNPIEGIWSDSKNETRLGVVKAPAGTNADYLAVILQTANPLWQPGEIKAEIHATATQALYTCTWYMGNKRPSGTTLSLEHESVLRASVTGPQGSVELNLLRVWPSNDEPATKAEQTAKMGTGFLLNSSGLIATNWHVVSGAKRVAVTFPSWTDTADADLIVRDVNNDLAILRIHDIAKSAGKCTELPFRLTSARNTTLGEHVSTIGYPLSPLLGSSPKFSEGVIAAKSGIQDDPRWFQVSAAIQPGSSGSPLFDSEGDIIGIVVASLDAAKAFQLTGAIPQNVNWAIKSDYLLSLAEMVPDASLPSRAASFSPEAATACIALVSAW